ncbi:hypothetical protein ACIP6I_10090 [Streptomyces anulatus]
MSTAMFGQQRQLDRRVHRTGRTQHRVRQLEQLVTTAGQTRVQLVLEA